MHKSLSPTSAGQSHGTYVPAIDGLRFLAVGSVLLFHLHHDLLPGGFTGVDVFFVLSGYLITGQLAGSRRPTLAQFYQNRIARIAPASLTVIAAVLIASWLLFSGRHAAYAGTAAAMAATSLINFKLLAQQGYFVDVGPTLPLLHFWSLAVEEQFYLVYPAMLLLLARFGMGRVIAIIGLFSLALCLALTAARPVWAFYLLPSRAWELCAGGWLALVHRNKSGRPERDQLLGGAGLGLLALAFITSDGARQFPGWQALIPVTATLLLINAARTEGTLPRILSSRLPVWVGLRSYSLYLWHWPVYVFTDYALYWLGWWEGAAVKAVLTVVLAVASYELVERPLRARLRPHGLHKAVFGGFFLAVAVLSGAGIALRNHAYLSAEGAKLTSGGYSFNPSGHPRVALVGDSQGAMYGTPLRDAAQARGWSLRVLAAAGTNQLPLQPQTRWATVLAWLQRDRPDVVILAEHWTDKLTDEAMLDGALSAIEGLGARAVIVLQPPEPAQADTFSPWAAGGRAVAPANPRALRLTNARIKAIAARHGGTLLVDPAPLFLDPRQRITLAAPDGQLWYDDGLHLSSKGAGRVLPMVTQAVERPGQPIQP